MDMTDPDATWRPVIGDRVRVRQSAALASVRGWTGVVVRTSERLVAVDLDHADRCVTVFMLFEEIEPA